MADRVDCIAPSVIATARIMQTVIPGAARAIAIGPSWLLYGGSERGRGLRQGRRVPRDGPIGLCDGEVIPIDGSLVRGKSGGRVGAFAGGESASRPRCSYIQEIYILPIQRTRTSGL